MSLKTAVLDASLLGTYAKNGAFTDCYATTVHGSVSLAELIEAFYTTPPFKVERWLLSIAMRKPSTDSQAHDLAGAKIGAFSVWVVENRSPTEILLSAWQTRSWLSVVSTTSSASTTLLFGSAVVPVRPGGKFGFLFHALHGFHQLYSKLLLAAAAKRILSNRNSQNAT
jgi:hypothetical protein